MIYNKNWFQLQPMYSFIRKQAENEKFLRYLEIGGTFTLIAIFLFFAIMPTMTTISSLLGEIKSKENFIEKANKKITNIIKSQENYSQMQEKYSLIEESFPSQSRFYISASNIATLFKNSSLEIDQLNLNLDNKNTQEENAGQFFKTYQIDISGIGTYSTVMDMLNKISNNRRLLNVSNVQINQIETKNNEFNSKNIKISLSNDLFFLPDN